MTSEEQLAQWMEEGLGNEEFVEDRNYYLNERNGKEGTVSGCALGAALVGKMKDAKAAYQLYAKKRKRLLPLSSGAPIFALLLNIHQELADAIDKNHCDGKPARQIIAELKRQTA